MKNDIKIGFWNYTKSNILSIEESVKDWNELGMNLAMSSECSTDSDYEYVLKCMDECQKYGISVIVCDTNVRYTTLMKVGEEQYKKNVDKACKLFSNHPAFYAFHIGDEPGKKFPYIVKAAKMVKENARPFINFYPFFEEDFDKVFSNGHDGYQRMIEDAIREIGLEMVSYDCYFQMFQDYKEEGTNRYFYNLRRFKEIADNTGVELWTTVLSVGHWCYKVPSEDDLRWQLSTAITYGVKGIMWFYIYGRTYEPSYRMSPIDLFYKKTQTYDNLSRIDGIFNTVFKERFDQSSIIEYHQIGKAYGGLKETSLELISGLTFTRRTNNPLTISKFIDKNNKEFIAIVNNSTEMYEQLIGSYNGKDFVLWFAPGEIAILE